MHGDIAKCCGNPYLEDIYSLLNRQGKYYHLFGQVFLDELSK